MVRFKDPSRLWSAWHRGGSYSACLDNVEESDEGKTKGKTKTCTCSMDLHVSVLVLS